MEGEQLLLGRDLRLADGDVCEGLARGVLELYEDEACARRGRHARLCRGPLTCGITNVTGQGKGGVSESLRCRLQKRGVARGTRGASRGHWNPSECILGVTALVPEARRKAIAIGAIE